MTFAAFNGARVVKAETTNFDPTEYCKNQWHKVRARFYDNQLSLKVWTTLFISNHQNNYSETCIIRPPLGLEKGGLYLQVVFISGPFYTVYNKNNYVPWALRGSHRRKIFDDRVW